MKNILLTISYDGTDFCGWQTQENKRTVQQEIENALTKIHKTKTIIYGSGRTDSGVHAVGQAANFYSPIDSIPTKNYIRALNSILSNDIRILDAKSVDPNFSARKSATSRIYRYFINFNDFLCANNSRFVWNVNNYSPNLQKLNNFCKCLHGEIDCASFTASGDESLSTNRYIFDAKFFIQKDLWQNDLLVFQIEANAFLWKMVRTLTGTLVNLDKNNADENVMIDILKAKNRTKAGITAPPQGLFLYKICFDGTRIHI